MQLTPPTHPHTHTHNCRIIKTLKNNLKTATGHCEIRKLIRFAYQFSRFSYFSKTSRKVPCYGLTSFTGGVSSYSIWLCNRKKLTRKDINEYTYKYCMKHCYECTKLPVWWWYLQRVCHFVMVGGLNNHSDPDSYTREAFERDCLLGGQRRGVKLRANLGEGQLQT